MLSSIVLVLVLVLISLSMSVTEANSAYAVPRTRMSLVDHISLGLTSKINHSRDVVVGITTTHGSNDDQCFEDILRKAIEQKPGYIPVGLFSISVNAFSIPKSDTNRYINSSPVFVCAADVLLEGK